MQMEREKRLMEQQMMLLQQKHKLLDLQVKNMTEEKPWTLIDFKVNDIKETACESPKEEEIKQILQDPEPLDEKKQN